MVGNPISFVKIVHILRRLPELEGRLPKDSEDNIIYPRMEIESANKAFGMKYRSAEDTFFDQAKKILELEKKLEGK